MHDEFELISCEKLKHLKIFVNDITYRNYHVHSSFELLLILKGGGTINLRSNAIPARENGVVLINPYEPHEIDAQGDHLLALIIQISRHFCEEYCPQLPNLFFLSHDLNEIQGREQIAKEMLHLAEVYLLGTDYDALTCVAEAAMLVKHLIEAVPNKRLEGHAQESMRKQIHQTERILNYLDENFTMQVRLRDIASLTGLSVTYVSHLFSERVGISIQEYLNNLRFERAMNLARNTELSVTEISLRSGFSDPRYLNQMMRKRFGCSVREYLTEQNSRMERFSSIS